MYNIYDLLPTGKVVEINQSVGLRMGHLVSQALMSKADFRDGASAYIDNGYILYLDVDGKLKSPQNVDAAILASQAPILHYTEELFDGISEELKHFVESWDASDEAYPRGLVLHLNDAFTTDNFSGTLSGATVAVVSLADDAAAGSFKVYANVAAVVSALTTYNGPLFHVVESDLPDAETPAVELTLLSTYVELA